MALLRDLREYFEQARKVKEKAPLAYRHQELRKFFPLWRESLDSARNPLDDEQPWINFAAASFLDAALRPTMRVFEYGSGGSTLFYGKRTQQVIAIEHDLAWAEEVRRRLHKRGFSHAEVRLIPPEPRASTAPLDPSEPRSYASNSKQYEGLSFEQYARSIEEFPDGFFSLVAVDGRARPSCVGHALAKVETGGWLMLDNAEREHYQRIHAGLETDQWELHDSYGPGPYNRYFWRTCIWRKIK